MQINVHFLLAVPKKCEKTRVRLRMSKKSAIFAADFVERRKVKGEN